MVISGPWTAKLEFLHVDLNGFSCDMACGNLTASDANGNLVFGGVNINASDQHHSGRAQFQDLEPLSMAARDLGHTGG